MKAAATTKNKINFKEFGIFIAFFALVIVLMIISPDAFAKPRNLINIIKQASVNGILSCLEYLGSTGNSADIFWADIMLTGLGAIMDVTVTISAAVGEIVRKNPSVSLRRLIHSGREIGYDIMGTMINVLLFVLASGMIPMFILKMNNDISFITIVRYHIPYDICRFLIESIGIVLAIPVSVFIASAIMKIPSRKRGVRE